jgi:hypothetical protein
MPPLVRMLAEQAAEKKRMEGEERDTSVWVIPEPELKARRASTVSGQCNDAHGRGMGLEDLLLFCLRFCTLS